MSKRGRIIRPAHKLTFTWDDEGIRMIEDAEGLTVGDAMRALLCLALVVAKNEYDHGAMPRVHRMLRNVEECVLSYLAADVLGELHGMTRVELLSREAPQRRDRG